MTASLFEDCLWRYKGLQDELKESPLRLRIDRTSNRFAISESGGTGWGWVADAAADDPIGQLEELSRVAKGYMAGLRRKQEPEVPGEDEEEPEEGDEPRRKNDDDFDDEDVDDFESEDDR